MRYLIVLKSSPYYIYSNSEDDATNIAEKYGNDVVGIVYAKGGLELLEVHTKVTLRPKEIKQIPLYVTTYHEGEPIIQEVPMDDEDFEDDEEF